jgi:hypothetical protein
MPPQPTAAERAASKAQDERLKKAKVSTKEGRVIASANRSEGSGAMKKFAAAGIAKKLPTSKQMGNLGMAKGSKVMKKSDKAGRALVKKSADTMGRAMMKKGYASGGLVAGHKSADGIATKGKTKGMEVKMARGGSTAMRGPRMDYAGVERKKGGSC